MRPVFPMLVLEYAQFGSLALLQGTSDPFPSSVKKKLCHDVSKGLVILHACGITHGDLKHENVLVFRNIRNRPIRWKRHGFQEGERRFLPSGETPPFYAPESHRGLDGEGLKIQMSILWAFSSGAPSSTERILSRLQPFPVSLEQIQQLKAIDALLPIAVHCIRDNEAIPLANDEKDLIDFVFNNTPKMMPENRSLRNITGSLQVHWRVFVPDLLAAVDEKNVQENQYIINRAPGAHGVTRDSLGLYLAKISYEHDRDYQSDDTRSSTVQIVTRTYYQFLFDPERLKGLLDWSLQVKIFQDLENAAVAAASASPTQVSKVLASFYLLRCYVREFGVEFDAERRVIGCEHVRAPATNVKKIVWLKRGVITDSDDKRLWSAELTKHTYHLHRVAGGVRMLYFFPRKLRRDYNLDNLDILDRDIQSEFAVRRTNSVDQIFVNHRGDGLLHMAAVMGELKALQHLVDTYCANIDLDDQVKSETPLLSACRGGHLECALFLLKHGARPDGSDDYGVETPLYWLCSFNPDDAGMIARKLVSAGHWLGTIRKKQT
ncbi:hypothetical protein C8J57DRAFT_1633740 [Mycena rebaudengoi]|nr:hypothetical protein C8J57DRAFT_1633740 [Mycena rebaudengoi]